MKVLFDSFFFELQYDGGINKVWFNLIRRIKENRDCNLSYIEGSETNNLFRNDLSLNNKILI
jgi:hypothetical protein